MFLLFFLGGGVEVSVIFFFNVYMRVIPVQDMGYSSGIWGIPLDMGYSTAGYEVFHMGYAVNWV